MKYFAIVAVFTFGILGFTVSKSSVKITTNPTKIDNILKEEKVILNKITCKLKDGNFCPLEIDSTEISIDCTCSDAEMILEPNLNELGKWDTKESKAVIEYAHNYFTKNSFSISEIKFIRVKEKHYLFVQVLEKMRENRFLFHYEK